MKKIILAFAVVMLASVSAFSQCDKKVKWQAAKGELVDESGTVVDTKEGPVIITTDSKNISFEIVDKPNESADGAVNGGVTCDWKEAFKNGKTTFKANMSGREGRTQEALFTIEGKDGKVVIYIELEKLQGKKIRINVDKYEVL